MKRKDWKIKSLKEGIFDKKKNIRKSKEKLFFLRKLFLRQYKYLVRKDLFFNYFFYNKFLKFFKLKKQNYFFNIYFKLKQNKSPFFPEYSTVKNVFNKKIKFKKFEKENNLEILFLPKKYDKKNFGLNFYFVDNFSIKNQNLNILKFFNEDDYKDLVHFKYNNVSEKKYFYINYFFSYNIYNLYVLEIYKILIFSYLNKLIIKYIYVGLNQIPIHVDLKEKLLVIILQKKNF